MTVPEFLFNNVLGLWPATLSKKRLWHKSFHANFAKIVRTHFLQKTIGQINTSGGVLDFTENELALIIKRGSQFYFLTSTYGRLLDIISIETFNYGFYSS